MPRIVLGNFGLEAPQAAPAADTSAIGEALQGLGRTVANVALVKRQQALALARAKAVNAALDDRNAVGDVAKSVNARLETGELDYDDAPDTLTAEVGKLKGPDLSGLDPITIESVNHARKVTRENAARVIAAAAEQRRAGDVERQTMSAFDKFATASTAPTADSHGILQQAEMLGDFARQAGVPAERIDAGLEGLAAAVAKSAATRDPQDALAKLSTPESGDATFDGLTYAGRLQVQEHAKSQLVKQSVAVVMGRYDEEGPDAGAAALAEAESKITDPELQDDIRAQVNQQIAQLRTQRRLEHAADLVELESDLATDSAGRQARELVDDLFEAGALSPSELAGYHAAIDQNTMRRGQQEAAQREIVEAIQSGLPLDPKNDDHRKFIEDAFAVDARHLKVGSFEWQAVAQAYAGETRMLPAQASSWLRSAARSPDPKLAASAAQFYGGLDVTSPEAAGSLDPNTRVFLASLSGMIEAGAQPEKAAEVARANIFETRRDVLEARQDAYKGHAKTNASALLGFIDSDFDTAFSRQPEASIFLEADFDRQTAAYYSKGGDIALARDLAWKDVRRIYGETRVNGEPMLSAFPVERFGVTPAEVRKDVDAFLRATKQPIKAEDVLVVPDGLTLRAVNDALSGQSVMPSYRLVTKTGDLVLDADGIPQRFALPGGEELTRRIKAAQEQAAQDAQSAIAEARASRARLDRAREQRLEMRRQDDAAGLR